MHARVSCQWAGEERCKKCRGERVWGDEGGRGGKGLSDVFADNWRAIISIIYPGEAWAVNDPFYAVHHITTH